MKLRELLQEGGAAIKISTPIEARYAKKVAALAIEKVAAALEIDKKAIEISGSLGKKKEASGDVDLLVDMSKIQAKDKKAFVDERISRLANQIKDSSAKSSEYDAEFYKAMPAISVYSFALPFEGGYAQVDVMPVESFEVAKWANGVSEEDVAAGLGGSQRNELIYAAAKYSGIKKTKDKSGNLVQLDRFFYDRSRGLLKGTQTRKLKSGKLGSSFNLVGQKTLAHADLDSMVKQIFGPAATPENLKTFDSVLKAIKSDSYPGKEHIQDVLTMAKAGMVKKNLKVPSELDAY